MYYQISDKIVTENSVVGTVYTHIWYKRMEHMLLMLILGTVIDWNTCSRD